MSEYRYYEFVAVDRPLTTAQQQELRALSYVASGNCLTPPQSLTTNVPMPFGISATP